MIEDGLDLVVPRARGQDAAMAVLALLGALFLLGLLVEGLQGTAADGPTISSLERLQETAVGQVALVVVIASVVAGMVLFGRSALTHRPALRLTPSGVVADGRWVGSEQVPWEEVVVVVVTADEARMAGGVASYVDITVVRRGDDELSARVGPGRSTQAEVRAALEGWVQVHAPDVPVR